MTKKVFFVFESNFSFLKLLDIPEKLTKIPIKTYKKIVSGLAEKEYWKQMHIAVVEYRRHHGCSSLSDFADGLSVNQVIKCKQLQQSEDLLIEIIENMLSSGAVLSEGKRTFIVTQLYLNRILLSAYAYNTLKKIAHEML